MKFGAKQRKFIILGFGIVAALVLIYVLFAEQFDGEGVADKLENRQELLRRYKEQIYLEGDYELALQQYRERLDRNMDRLLEGDNTNVAESELLKVLTDFADNNGIEITQKIVQREEKVEDTLYKVSARFVTRCDSEKLVRFLTDIRNYSRFLTIDELTIQIRTTRGQTIAEMRPTLTVSGYVQVAETEVEEGGTSASS